MSSSQRTRFRKYHALGNDYLVLDPADWRDGTAPAPDEIKRICHRHYGLGSDGILWGPLPATNATTGNAAAAAAGAAAAGGAAFGLRIFNPDGSEAEKSGNGLRIFSRHLFDRKLVDADAPFRISTPGGVVESTILDGGARVRVEMGRVSFDSARVPVLLDGEAREVLGERLTAGGREFVFNAATIGNPHCVIVCQRGEARGLAKRHGSAIETHPLFPNRTNVQFLEVIDPRTIHIEIWERGAGYTFASGSSGSAAAAVAHRLGLVGPEVTVNMRGGNIQISIAPDFSVTMTGGVTPVGEFFMEPDVLTHSVEF
ncbi:MAG: diaminopimelate epimerase [Puniceicoccales bacterium]|jgi:diaminopimelate epimerase|nr:diaminopimelate epimerase [Puniceicoccales bacterium]